MENAEKKRKICARCGGSKWRKSSLLLGILILLLSGCGKNEAGQEKKALDYTVTSEQRLPEELKNLIDDKKEEPFKMTYQDGAYLYICQGYGAQSTGGYSIQVKDVYRTDNAIYFASTLIGPAGNEPQPEAASYPYIVIKLEYTDMTVVFDS